MVLAVIFTVCNSWAQKDDDNTIVFSPHWTAQAQYAGYYVAEAKGFYREAGIKVKIHHPAASQSAMSMLLSNQVQVATMQLTQALAVVEAMKMETSVVARMAGVVEEILISEGDTVKAGQLLMKIK